MLTVKPRVIHDDVEYRAALKILEEHWDDPSGEVQDVLDVIGVLVEAYEREHHPLPAPDPVEALRFYMEQRGLAGRDLEPYIGPRSRVSEILNRKRPLTLEMIRRLHWGLDIPLEALIGEPCR